MAPDSPTQDVPDLPDALLEEAAIWHARLLDARSDPSLAAARQTDFERWLAADPRHARAFEETQQLWAKLEEPVAEVLSELETKTKTGAHAGSRRTTLQNLWSPVFPRGALATCCCLFLAVAGVLYHDEAIDRLRSDHMTAVGERLPLTLEDGSEVTLNSDSAVAFDVDNDSRRVHLLRGEAWFEVAAEPDRPFTVETPLGSVRVTGTSFNLRLQEDRVTVSLLEGRLALRPASATSTELEIAPGQQASLLPAGVSEVTPFDETALTAWLRGQLVFYNTSLGDVVAELNRYRDGHIIVMNSDLERLKVSGVFRTDDPNAALTVIANTLPVRVDRLTNYFVLLR